MTGWGNAELHQRTCEPVKSRCRCRCGCKGRVTHAGMANGVALVSGCQLSVRRWVRAPADFSVKETPATPPGRERERSVRSNLRRWSHEDTADPVADWHAEGGPVFADRDSD